MKIVEFMRKKRKIGSYLSIVKIYFSFPVQLIRTFSLRKRISKKFIYFYINVHKGNRYFLNGSGIKKIFFLLPNSLFDFHECLLKYIK